MSANQRETIVSFLLRLLSDIGDRMPNSDEVHLPFFRKRDVYLRLASYLRGITCPNIPTGHYFAKMWRSFCRHIKVRKVRRFAKCATCETLKSPLRDGKMSRVDIDDVRRQKEEHLKFVLGERVEYKMKVDRVIHDPGNHRSLIIDGPDQSAFGLPHFVTTVKTTKGHSLKIKLVVILQHGTPKKLRLYTMSE